MGKTTGSKRSQTSAESSPASSAKKLKTEKKKLALQSIAKPVKKSLDPELQAIINKFVTPEDAIQFLLTNAKMTVGEFFKNYWEKAPLVMRAPEKNDVFKKVFGYEYLCSLLNDKKVDDFIIERDYVLSKYSVELGKPANEEEALIDSLTEESLKSMMDKEFGIQINQPQRFQDVLWAMLERMESYFGSLVGAYAFIAPKGVQMTGPLYDDVEKFAIQLEGQKTWKLYKPLLELATDYKDDLTSEQIGEPIMTVTMKPGDVLYIPRGTVNQAVADTQSTDIVLYTYQNQTVLAHLEQTVRIVLDTQNTKCIDLRRGLPIGFLPAANSITNEEYADALVKVAENIRKDPNKLPVPEDLLHDFMSNRLPPFGADPFNLEAIAPPKSSDFVRFRNTHHVTWYARKSQGSAMDEMADEELAEEEEENLEEMEIIVLSSLCNSKDSHMLVDSRVFERDGDAFAVTVDYEPLLQMIMNSTKPIKVSDLPKKNETGKPLDIMMLVRGLFNIGALEVVS